MGDAEKAASKGRGWLAAGIIITVVLVIGFAQRDGSEDLDDSPGEERCWPKEIVYELDGTAPGADITIQNASGNSEQARDRAIPQEYDAGVFPCGSFVYLSMQNTGERGTVICRIKADGVVIEEASSSGAYVIASCSGSVPP